MATSSRMAAVGIVRRNLGEVEQDARRVRRVRGQPLPEGGRGDLQEGTSVTELRNRRVPKDIGGLRSEGVPYLRPAPLRELSLSACLRFIPLLPSLLHPAHTMIILRVLLIPPLFRAIFSFSLSRRRERRISPAGEKRVASSLRRRDNSVALVRRSCQSGVTTRASLSDTAGQEVLAAQVHPVDTILALMRRRGLDSSSSTGNHARRSPSCTSKSGFQLRGAARALLWVPTWRIAATLLAPCWARCECFSSSPLRMFRSILPIPLPTLPRVSCPPDTYLEMTSATCSTIHDAFG